MLCILFIGFYLKSTLLIIEDSCIHSYTVSAFLGVLCCFDSRFSRQGGRTELSVICMGDDARVA